MKRTTYFIRSIDGTDYRVGVWRDGMWLPGSRSDAIRERSLLDEPGAYVWGLTVTQTALQFGPANPIRFVDQHSANEGI